MKTRQEEMPFVVVPPPFWKCFGGFLPGAGSPLILTIRGRSGIGKSEISAAIASKYRERGWYAAYALLEYGREHVARHAVDVDELTRVYEPDFMSYCEEFFKEYRKRKLPTVLVVDSIAVLGESSSRIGARRDAINKTTTEALKKLNLYPTIVILIAQHRQGAPLPHNPFVSGTRGSFAASNEHTMHLVAKLSEQGGKIKVDIEHHSLSLYQKGDDGRVYPLSFQRDFKCVSVSIDSPYDLEMPPVVSFPGVVTVYEVPTVVKKQRGKKKDGERDSDNLDE